MNDAHIGIATGRALCLTMNVLIPRKAKPMLGRIEICSQQNEVNDMIDKADIRRIAEEIGKVSKAERVVLFGSYASGRMTPESDVDLLVVAESELPRHKRSRDLYRNLRPLRFPMDIVVYTPDEVRQGVQTPVSFISQV